MFASTSLRSGIVAALSGVALLHCSSGEETFPCGDTQCEVGREACVDFPRYPAPQRPGSCHALSAEDRESEQSCKDAATRFASVCASSPFTRARCGAPPGDACRMTIYCE